MLFHFLLLRNFKLIFNFSIGKKIVSYKNFNVWIFWKDWNCLRVVNFISLIMFFTKLNFLRKKLDFDLRKREKSLELKLPKIFNPKKIKTKLKSYRYFCRFLKSIKTFHRNLIIRPINFIELQVFDKRTDYKIRNYFYFIIASDNQLLYVSEY